MAHTLRLTASSQLRLPPSPLRHFPCGPLSLSPHRQLLTNHLPFGCISLLAFFRCGCHWHVPQILSAICRQKSRYLSPCLSVYLSLSSLSSWQFVCHSALSLSLPVYRFFGCLDFATATKNVPATLCIEVFVTLPELLLLLLLLLQPMQLAIFHTTSQSVPPSPL